MVAVVLRRFLTRLDFDEHMERWGFKGFADWSPRASPALLVTRAVSWSIVLVGFTLGLAAFDAALSSRLAFSLFSYLPNVLTAILLVIVGAIVARVWADTDKSIDRFGGSAASASMRSRTRCSNIT